MTDDGGQLRSVESLADEAAEKIPELTGERHVDMTGGAVYYLAGPGEGTDWTLVACRPCEYVSVIPSIPRKPILFWSCPNGHRYRLEPPLAVLVAGIRPIPGPIDGDPRGPIH